MNWIRVGDKLVNLAQATEINLDMTLYIGNEEHLHGVKIYMALATSEGLDYVKFVGDEAVAARDAIAKTLNI